MVFLVVTVLNHESLLQESSEVTGLQANTTSDTTLVISWEPPANPKGIILNYSISIVNLKDGSTVREENISDTFIMEANLGMTLLEGFRRILAM